MQVSKEEILHIADLAELELQENVWVLCIRTFILQSELRWYV